MRATNGRYFFAVLPFLIFAFVFPAASAVRKGRWRDIGLLLLLAVLFVNETAFFLVKVIPFYRGGSPDAGLFGPCRGSTLLADDRNAEVFGRARPDGLLGRSAGEPREGGGEGRGGGASGRASRLPARALPLALLLPAGRPGALRSRRTGAGADDRGARAGGAAARRGGRRARLRAARARPVPQQRGGDRRRRQDRGALPQDAHPRRPAYYEKFYFTPGDLGFPAFDTAAGRIATLICWDQWYPEGARLAALAGASVLFYPTAIGWHPHEKAEHGAAQRDAWRTVQRGHAIANGVYVAAVNRVGLRDSPRAAARASSSGAPRSSPTRRASSSPRPRPIARRSSSPRSTRRASRTCAATGPSCATGASTPTAGSPAGFSTRTRGRKDVAAAEDARRAGLSDAGRVGAARGDLDRLAAQQDRLARASSRRSRGSTARSSAGSRRERSCAILVESRAHEAARAPRPRAVRLRHGAGRVLPCSRPTAAGRATRARPSCAAREGAAKSRSAASGSTAGRTTPTGRRTTPSRRRSRARSDCRFFRRGWAAGRSCSKAARSTSTARGTLLTTEECLLDPKVQVRNPGMTRRDYEKVFRDFLGARNVLWLGRGIAGDDTHGHVDDIAASSTPRTVVLCREKNSVGRELSPARGEPREARRDAPRGRLEDRGRLPSRCRRPSSSTAGGSRPPTRTSTSATPSSSCPPSTTRRTGSPWPSSPRLFRDRPVVGIHAVDLVWGLGTIHCLTRQQPAITSS